MRTDESSTLEWRCVYCGRLFREDDRTVLTRKYTNHVVREHDKPELGSLAGNA